MLRALYTSASGMQGQQMNLDVIANNLANVNTTGFKKSKMEFQDMLYQTNRAAGAEAGGGNQVPTSMQVGHGARAVATSKVFTNGELHQTGDKLDIAIHGNGFFKVTLADGTDAFSRDGAFKMSNAGNIVTSDGLPVASFAGITIPSNATNVSISTSGAVSTTIEGVTSNVGQIMLSRFANPGGMESMGGSLYKSTLAAGTEETGLPGLTGMGSVQQGWLELSNVKVVEEMVNLIKAQRAYEINSKAIQAADEMMQMSNRLRG